MCVCGCGCVYVCVCMCVCVWVGGCGCGCVGGGSGLGMLLYKCHMLNRKNVTLHMSHNLYVYTRPLQVYSGQW